ncbi:MAG: nuclear transport factor 2 family protein [Ilumatobacter sp.]|uniref:nuclear transport factor 2 family protein n=1 Tax=Ilumatobacter sp. TaxID=1967498 RepID=UPI00260D81F4|nr:nuclear transport factor 2 family protein [Ilumatobacter sp.]MDJ0771676.1 nuclear transport factor 2 family protein [Ilumatobacter sp.]
MSNDPATSDPTSHDPATSDPVDDPAAVVRSYWDRVWLDRDLDALDELATDPSIRHTSHGTNTYTVGELKEHIGDALCAIRTEEVTFDALTVDGPMVWLRATVRAVSLATMTPLDLAWLAQYRVEGGRIAEAWALHQSNMDWGGT